MPHHHCEQRMKKEAGSSNMFENRAGRHTIGGALWHNARPKRILAKVRRWTCTLADQRVRSAYRHSEHECLSTNGIPPRVLDVDLRITVWWQSRIGMRVCQHFVRISGRNYLSLISCLRWDQPSFPSSRDYPELYVKPPFTHDMSR